MIPKRIILIYKTKNLDKFPEFYKTCYDRIVEFFDDYEICLFDDDEMDSLVKSFDSNLYENVYSKMDIIQKTDIFRLVALYVYGGTYMDLDVYLESNPKSYSRILNRCCCVLKSYRRNNRSMCTEVVKLIT